MPDKLDFGNANHAVTNDLIAKAVKDIGAVMRRLRSIAPDPFLPVAIGAGVNAIVPIAVELHHMSGEPYKGEPDPDCMMLAALLLARTGISDADAVAEAYRDLDALKAAGRIGDSDA